MRKGIIAALSLVLFLFVSCNLLYLDTSDASGNTNTGYGVATGFKKMKNLKSIYGFNNYDSIGLAQKKSTELSTRDAVGENPFLVGLAQDGSVESVYIVDENGQKLEVNGIKSFTKLTDEYSLMVIVDSDVDNIDSYNTSIYKTGIEKEIDYIVNTKTGKLYKLEDSYKKLAKDLLEANGFEYFEKYLTDSRYYESFDGLFRNQMIPSDDSIYLFGYINLNNNYKVAITDTSSDEGNTDCDGADCQGASESDNANDNDSESDFSDDEGLEDGVEYNFSWGDGDWDDNVNGGSYSNDIVKPSYFDDNIYAVAQREYENYTSKYPDCSLTMSHCLYNVALGYSLFANDDELKNYIDYYLYGVMCDEARYKPSVRYFKDELYNSGVKSFLENNTDMLESESVKEYISEYSRYYYGWKYYSSVFPTYDIEYSKYLFIYKLVFDGDNVSLELYDKVACFDFVEINDDDASNRYTMKYNYFHQILFCNKTILNQLYWDADGDTNCGFVYDIPSKQFVENDYDNVEFKYGGKTYKCGNAFDDSTNRYTTSGLEFVPFAVGDNCRYYAFRTGFESSWASYYDLKYGNNLRKIPEGFIKIDSNNNVVDVVELSDQFRNGGVVASSVMYNIEGDYISILYLSQSDKIVTLSLEDSLYSVFEDVDAAEVASKQLESVDGRCILALTMNDGNSIEFEVTANGKIVKYQESDIEILDLEPVNCK